MQPSKPKTAKQEIEQQLAEARSWETSRVMAGQRSIRTAWTIAIIATLVAAISVTGISFMGPQLKVEPFVIRVDNTTGIVDVVSTLTNKTTNYDEVINKYFTQNYIRNREGYSYSSSREQYAYVGLMSGQSEKTKYFEAFNPSNPNSPLNIYKNLSTVDITIKSTSFISPTVALVRYTKVIELAGVKSISNWAATITFTYNAAAMTDKNREINPLGFTVTEYRNDPEGEGFIVDRKTAETRAKTPTQHNGAFPAPLARPPEPSTTTTAQPTTPSEVTQ